MNHFIEILSLIQNLACARNSIVSTSKRHCPLLKRWNFDVVAHGPSLHDENSYYVIRRFDSLAQREEIEDAYYASDDWRLGPRERILALIKNYADIVLELDEVTVRGLRIKQGGGGYNVRNSEIPIFWRRP